MDAFNDAIEKLLWPEKRLNKDSIWRTQNECTLHLRKEFVPKPLQRLADSDGYIKIGTIPKGMPINLIGNLDPDFEQLVVLQAKIAKALVKIHSHESFADEATAELQKSVPESARSEQMSRLRRRQRTLFRHGPAGFRQARADRILENVLARQQERKQMAVTVPEMLKMSQAQLDDLFTQSPVGEIPSGEAKGTAIIAPGTTYTHDIANFINHFAWQGKVFDPSKGDFAKQDFAFRTQRDHRQSLQGFELDGSTRSASSSIIPRLRCVAHWVRDEIREVAPRTYLGKVYLGKKRLIDFALEFPAAT